MLVLTRRIKERVVIDFGGTAVVVTLCDTRCGTARLGFEAADDVHIHREEIYHAIARNGRHAKTDPRLNAGDRRQAITGVAN